MESPNMPSIHVEPPRSADRRRRGRGVDVMSAMPTPERPQRHDLPTPVTQRRTDKLAPTGNSSVHLPTPQTLPRKRASPRTTEPSSPSGHTSFFFSQSDTAEPVEKVPPRRRPGLMFAQQMGLSHTASAPASEMKFGGRLGVGVGMGGTMRTSHGPVDKVSLENPFLVNPKPSSSSSSSVRTANASLGSNLTLKSRAAPPAPGTETSYIPQALRPSAERSLSPHPRRRPRFAGDMLAPGAGPSTRAARRQAMMDEDNPFIAKPGEVVRPHPTIEDGPTVTYVFRGSKKVFANPFFAPGTAHPPSELDPSDPNFDPHPCPPPRLLFPTPAEPSASTSLETPQRPKRSLQAFESMDVDHGPLDDDYEDDLAADRGDESDEEEEELPARRGMLFGPSSGMKRDRDPVGFEARKRTRA